MDVLPLCPEFCENLTALVQQCLVEVVLVNELVNILTNFNCSDTLPAFVHKDQEQCAGSETNGEKFMFLSVQCICNDVTDCSLYVYSIVGWSTEMSGNNDAGFITSHRIGIMHLTLALV